MKKFLSLAADIVFRASCIANFSAVKMELNFCSVADSVRFPVEAAAPTPISFLEPSVYM